MKRKIELDFLQIALSNLCNLNCGICIQNEEKFRILDKCFMDDSVFNSLVKGVKKGIYPDSIYLFWNDEPMIHPLFEDYFTEIYELFDNGFTNEIIISTNGHFLDKYGEMLGRLNRSGLKIILSIDGGDENTYKKIRGEDFNKLIKNIEVLLESRGENRYPQIIYQMILLPENKNEIEKFRKIFTDLNKRYGGIAPQFTFDRDGLCQDSIYIKCAYPWGDGTEYDKIKLEYIRIAEKYGFHNAVKQAEIVAEPRDMSVCRDMFKGAVVHPDGNISPCCVDFDGSISFGILPREDLYDILTGEIKKRFEEAMLENNTAELPQRCRYCNLPQGRVIEKN